MLQITNKTKRLITLLRYLSLNKIINGGKLILSYFFSLFGFQSFKLLSPYFISIEVSNYCNLHCPECPVGIKKTQKIDRTTFNLDLYKKIIDELSPKLFHAILYFQGEPTLNNQFAEFIHYAHASKIYTSTSTNGQFLTEKTAKEIVLSGLDKLIISVDGTTQETYQSYRIGGDFQKVLNGIEDVVRWKNLLKTETPLLEIQFLVLKTNEHQMKEMRQLAKKLKVDRISFKTAQLYDFENGNNLMPTKSKYSRYRKNKTGKYEIKNRQANRCWRMWSGAVVNVHGDVLPCCFDKGSEFAFGNLYKSSFYDCWHNEKASDFRAKILQNRKQFEICRNCTG